MADSKAVAEEVSEGAGFLPLVSARRAVLWNERGDTLVLGHCWPRML